jgi:TolB-like protein
MNPSAPPPSDETRNQFNLGYLLTIALAGVVGTTLTVWAFHFMHIGMPATLPVKPFPRIAVLPFHSLSDAADDLRYDRQLTNALIAGLARISRVEALPPQTDADPVLVGRQLGVKMLLIGKVERLRGQVRVTVQMISARDGNQLWQGSFDGNSQDLALLSARIDKALAPHLTALLD